MITNLTVLSVLKMTKITSLRLLYDKYRAEVFLKLDATNLTKDFFYDQRISGWYELITSRSLEEVLFTTSCSYGASWTTEILRFQVQYDRIPKDGKVDFP